MNHSIPNCQQAGLTKLTRCVCSNRIFPYILTHGAVLLVSVILLLPAAALAVT